MTLRLPSLALAAALAAGAAHAAEPTLGTVLGTDLAAISTALGAENYDLVRYLAEGERIEVTALREDARLDLVLDAATGEVVGLSAGLRSGAPDRGGLDDAALRDALAAEGYTVRSYERERGRVEVYAEKDGRLWELKVDPLTGRILEIEAEG